MLANIPRLMRAYFTGRPDLSVREQRVTFGRGSTSEKDVHVGYALRAEMRLPGEATLRFSIEPVGQPARSRLVQTARFRPRGLLGLAYWYGVMRLHGIACRRVLAGIRRLAEADARAVRRAKESGTAGQVEGTIEKVAGRVQKKIGQMKKVLGQ